MIIINYKLHYILDFKNSKFVLKNKNFIFRFPKFDFDKKLF